MADIDWEQLRTEAIGAMKRAYAPYSKFPVGVAAKTDDGRIVTGCNVENASYGLTICAERNAVFAAIAQGDRRFTAIAITADARMPYPCGACRQVLAEFCPVSTPVFVAPIRALSRVQRFTLGDLLPHQFSL